MVERAKILIVDDILGNIQTLRMILSDFDVEFVDATNGQTAISLCQEHDFALLLLDIQMPGMTGFDVARTLSEEPKTSKLPIIFITAGLPGKQYELEGYTTGAVDYIQKPIRHEVLIPKVNFFLKLHQSQQELKKALEGEKKANAELQIEIVHRKSLEERLLESIRETEDATKAKSDFLSTMSHEIRTPMNGVLGMAELLSKTNLDAEQSDKVQIIVDSGSLLLTIINDILNFSKLEAGHVILESIPFDLERTIHDVMQSMSIRTFDKNIELILDYPPSAPNHFIGDPARIRQILNNLLGNALKFTETGFIRVSVSAQETTNNHANLVIGIEDTGIGIEEDKIERLFSDFTQADHSIARKYGGTGLGLSICKQLVKLMDGDIDVNSVHGEGSTFNVNLGLPIGKKPKKFAEKSLKGTKVLFVDDNAINRNLYSELLDHFGVTAQILPDATQVLDTLAQCQAGLEKFDIAILDCNILGESGLEIGKKIREEYDSGSLKLMALTSVAQLGEAKSYSEAGFDAYLTKPLMSTKFRDALMSLLQTPSDRPLITQHSIEESRQCGSSIESGHILVVEDNKINQIITQNMLLNLGQTVDVAEDGNQAIESFENGNYDLIFMDCRMPELDGYDAAKAIRKLENDKRIPIIALTANALLEDKEKCFNSGMDDFITKPCSASQLEEALEKWLKK